MLAHRMLELYICQGDCLKAEEGVWHLVKFVFCAAASSTGPSDDEIGLGSNANSVSRESVQLAQFDRHPRTGYKRPFANYQCRVYSLAPGLIPSSRKSKNPPETSNEQRQSVENRQCFSCLR